MLITKSPTRHSIACHNWPELFPYAPKVDFEIYHSKDMLHISYHVVSEAVRAVCEKDKERVWEDSCVEFFFMPEGSEVYYNLECTCIGKIYLCSGKDRHGRTPLEDSCYESIRRECSLGSEPFGLREGEMEWTVCLDVPASCFGLKSFEGAKGKGNFYSCGDALPRRHYITWAPISTEKPDYHRPECFETIEFE